MQLASFFLGSHALQLELYGGLLLFTGYVLFDSQAMVERAAGGARDYVGDAFGLFVDLAAIFTRLLVILLQQQQRRGSGQGGSRGSKGRREEEEEERQRRRGRDHDPKGKGRAW